MPRRRTPEGSALTMPAGRRIPRPPVDRPGSPPPAEPAAIPPAIAKAGGELSALATAIRACEACSRASDKRAYGSGAPRARVLLVKDRPSAEDLRTRTAFTEDAPALERAFDRLRIARSDVYGATAVRCASRTATSDEARTCAVHLLIEIEAVEPDVLVVFGDRALDAVRALDGRCGLRVPDEIPRGDLVELRRGLSLLLTEALPEGIREPEAKRRLWRDLQLLARAPG